MVTIHAEVQKWNTLVNTKVETGGEPDKKYPQLRRIGAISGDLKQFIVFSVILKDVRATLPPELWETIVVEKTENQTLLHIPDNVAEEHEGSFLALDVRIPQLEVGEKQTLRITQVEQRTKVPGVAGNYEIWRKRWLSSFNCEPPAGAGLSYEIQTEPDTGRN